MKKYVTPGIVLILAGLYFLLGALPGVNLPEGTFFVLVGLGLLIGRLTTGKCGFTISGFIVLCLGAGWMAADLLVLPGKYASVVTPLALSLAFFLIHICEFRRIGNWPIIPALILLCVGGGLLILFTPGLNALLKPYYGTIFPALYLGLLSTCLCFFLQTAAQKYADATKAVIFLSMEGVFGSLFSVMLGLEPFTWMLGVGGSMLFLSAVLTEVKLPAIKKRV